MKIIVKQVSKILNRLNIRSTVDATARLINNKLKRVPYPNNHHNSDYANLEDLQNLEQYLVYECGLDVNKVHAIIYGSIAK